MYDDFSQDYDRFVDWAARLEVELPFIEKQFQRISSHVKDTPRVLDSACGTGMHAIALAGRGYRLTGADLSPAMIAQARRNAAGAGVDVRFAIAGLGDMAAVFHEEFDALLCLGNSLPHVPDENGLRIALRDMSLCLRPGGLLLIQNRNFDAILGQRSRWMEPQARREGEREWVFVRFYDFDADGHLTFHLLTLQREGRQPWSQRHNATRLMPIRRDVLIRELGNAGFTGTILYGDMSGAPFEENDSPNLIVTAVKPK